MTTAREMVDMLRRHYLPESREPGGIFAPEIQAPGSTRRADLIWQGCTAAGGHELVGHEIKVSRADLLTELADPAKSDPWQRYCDRWWLVLSDPALAEGLEIPPSWGVMAPPSGRRTRSMTVLMPAPQLKPAEQGPALKTLAVWLHWRLHRTQAELRSAEHSAQQSRDRAYRAETRLAAAGERETPTGRIVSEIVTRLGGQYSLDDEIGTWECHVDVDDVVAALQELGAIKVRVEDARDTLSSTHRQMRRLREQLDHELTKEVRV